MKVVHLSLFEPYNGQTDFYFGSIKAIYEHVPKERVGIAYTSLTSTMRGKGEYRNKKCVIKVGELHQHPQANKQQPV